MGGHGLRAAADHASSAFASSILGAQLRVQDLVGGRHVGGGQSQEDRERREENYQVGDGVLGQQLLANLSIAQGEQAVEADLVGMTQKQMSVKVDLEQKRQLAELFGEDEEREKARLLSISLDNTGDSLNTPPLIALGLHLRPVEFVLVVKYCLGLPVFDQRGPCPACLQESDVLGDHALCCGSGGERISRHNALRDAIIETAVATGLGPVKEGRFLLPGNDRPPADVLVPNWTGGKDAAMDVEVTTPIKVTTMPGAANTAGFALDHAHKGKLDGAEEACRRQGLAFLPLVAETFGGWHPSAQREVKKMGSALARDTGQDEAEAVSHVWGRRGNAAILGNRVPALPDPQIDGIM